MPYFVYLLRCSDDSLYCGYTSDVKKRFAAHSSGRGSKYVRARRPAKLVYFEKLPSQRAAMRRELEIKGMGRKEKLALL